MKTPEPIEVSDEQYNEYWERGYWISPKLFDDAQIARLREAHHSIWRGERDFDTFGYLPFSAPDPQSSALRKLDNGWWINAEIRKTVTSPVLGRIGARLMNTPEVRLWHDQVLWKPPVGDSGDHQKGNVGWHQDYGYWQASSTDNMCTAWIALQDTDLSNGGMMTIVGSHKWGLIPASNTFFEPDLDQLRRRYGADGREWIEEPCIMKAGQVSFHHALCFHGSGPNLSNEPRLSLVAHLMPADCAYRPRIQHHNNVRHLGPYAKAGDLFDGECFPRLWPATD